MANSVVINPKDDKTEPEFQGPVSSYDVIKSEPPASNARFVAAELYPTDGQNSGGQERVAQSKFWEPPPPRAVAPKDTKAAASRTKVYAAMGVGLGILAAGLSVFFMRPLRADGSYDFGAMTASANGLTGHLMTNWGDRLDYKLTVEPSDPSQQAAFENAVINSPRPLSVDVQLKSPTGVVICDSTVLLKFDPLRNNSGGAPSDLPVGSKKVDEVSADREQVAQALNRARLVGQELNREQGRDVFQNNAGTNGQITSISAQGTLPCTKKQYQSTASWAFTSTFPIVAQQTNLQGQAPNSGQSGDSATSAGSPAQDVSAQKSTAAGKAKRKMVLPVSHFYLEEDDAVAAFQASTGIIETRAGKAFQMEKRDLVTSALKGAELPLPIHYRCDQFGACALAGIGVGVQRAWLER